MSQHHTSPSPSNDTGTDCDHSTSCKASAPHSDNVPGHRASTINVTASSIIRQRSNDICRIVQLAGSYFPVHGLGLAERNKKATAVAETSLWSAASLEPKCNEKAHPSLSAGHRSHRTDRRPTTTPNALPAGGIPGWEAVRTAMCERPPVSQAESSPLQNRQLALFSNGAVNRITGHFAEAGNLEYFKHSLILPSYMSLLSIHNESRGKRLDCKFWSGSSHYE